MAKQMPRVHRQVARVARQRSAIEKRRAAKIHTGDVYYKWFFNGGWRYSKSYPRRSECVMLASPWREVYLAQEMLIDALPNDEQDIVDSLELALEMVRGARRRYMRHFRPWPAKCERLQRLIEALEPLAEHVGNPTYEHESVRWRAIDLPWWDEP